MSNVNGNKDTFVYRVYDTIENKFCVYGLTNIYSENCGKSIWSATGPTTKMLKYFQKRTKNELAIKKFKLVEYIGDE